MKNNRIHKPLQYAYTHRKKNSSNFKRKSNKFINSMVTKKGLKFNTFKHFLNTSFIKLDTKMLQDLAKTEAYTFNSIIYLKKLKEYRSL
jgi:large subunit ribosomal protein L20